MTDDFTLSEAKEIWTTAHRLWIDSTKFPDEPQATVAWCYATATLQLLERKRELTRAT